MDAVRINTGPIEAELFLDEVPRESWGTLLRARKTFVKTSIPHDCRELLRFVEEADQMFEELGFANLEELIRNGLEIDPDLVGWAVKGLRSLKPDEPVTLDAAVRLGKHGRQGAPRDEKGHFVADRSKGSNYNLRGTTAEYTLARLDRDRPDIAARVRAGELSANAGAIEAGFRKPPEPLVERTLRAVARMSDAELYDFESRFDAFLQQRRAK